ncbi:disintegrin and metalloproteinase domain-containing protein 8-like [Sinocyclocheilus rhinocerous]|uniref:disintegrin and metalloproteinase domain-containing protein 8-like n=1 Tax=Sinocyclocheilus rhinocerous TaxID=307959 RepID=UPI0007BAAE89|nr:PREDICTED: disintegrin and metalloproteinase domain-containing protein 8-like [Sinocyclocheilus rhinocerous]
MRYTGLFISLLSFVYTWENLEAANPALPHVMRYDVIRLRPQALKERARRSAPSLKTYPEQLEYDLAVDGRNFTLSLHKNRELLGNHYTLSHYTEDGISETKSSDNIDHCYYQGHVHDFEDSSVSVGLCSGMEGFLRVKNQVYLIEPLEESLDGDHAIYKQEHLRTKQGAFGYINDTVYNLGPKSSGLYKGKNMKNKAPRGGQRIVEMVLVVDHTEYNTFGSFKKIEERMMLVANHVDKLYRPLNIRVRLVGLEIWSQRDLIDVSHIPNLTLERFLQWRQDSLLKRKKHDNAHFITAVDFEGSTVGLATVYAMCSPSSGAVNEDHNKNPIAVASTIAHEMGHNLGMSHDDPNCGCSSGKGCIMSDTIGYVYPDSFSTCSQSSLKAFLQSYDTSCLLDMPNEGELYGGPVCGNAFVEKGEECDCGTAEECNNPCCNATTCRLTEGAHCAHGECCHNCQLKHSGSLCRKSAHDCDLDEYCTGVSAFCPEDEYKMNGLPCNYNQGYCYNGQCPTHKEHCKMLWGSDAEVDADTCFRYNVIDRTSKSAEHMMCGKIYCYGGNAFPITNRKSSVTIQSRTCYMAVDSSPTDDLGMVPAGTKCGIDKVCYNNLCQDVSIYGSENCSNKCNNRGVCNHERKCHCDPGWAPPYCGVQFSELQKMRKESVIIGVTASVVVLGLIIIIGALVCHRNKITEFRKKRSLKDIHTSSGQCNPAFQPGSAKNSPRCTQSRISQPTFLESSTALACKPLYSPAMPSRQAPLPPKNAPQTRTEQIVKPSIPPPGISRNIHPVQVKPLLPPTKPLPPSRPLPPLASKPVTKSKPPPVPPVKPTGMQPAFSPPQVIQKVALKPARPR